MLITVVHPIWYWADNPHATRGKPGEGDVGGYPITIPLSVEPRPVPDCLRLRDDIYVGMWLAEAIDPNDTALRVGRTVHGVGPRATWWPTSVGAFATGLRLAISHERDGIPLPPSVVHCNVQRSPVAVV